MGKRPKEITVGAPEWMATYSDMMSLLLCFFILLFSVAEEKREKVFELIMGFQQYFESEGKRLGYYPKKVTLREIPGFLQNAIRAPSRQGSMGRSLSKQEILEKIDQYASVYEKDNHQLMVIPGMVLFERGQAEIQDGAEATLGRVARVLRKRAKMDIQIIGHTSSWPLGPESSAPDHLTLGFERALNIANYLAQNEGIPLKRITVATQGHQSPSPTRKNLWEDPDQDDRVEITFLPAYDID